MNLYFDNASTSFPKPNNVINSVNNFVSNIGASPSRGYYNYSMYSNKILFKCREALCNLFNYNKSENIIFTYNATYAFNLLLNGIVHSNLFNNKPHVLVSHFDHNSTIRPLLNLQGRNLLELDYINSTPNNFIDLKDIEYKIKPNTKFLIISHMSNVIGNIQDIENLSKLCKKYNLFFILDIAQSAGIVDINLNSTYFSAIFFSGHKNLFSTQGVGGFIISDIFLNQCENFFLGGTGSESSNLIQKDNMPDYYEVGTHNMLGISSLLSGINFINSFGINNIFQHKKYLLKHLNNELKNISNILILNDVGLTNQNSTLCINFKNFSPNHIGFILDKYFKISVRVGLHCSPNTHKILKTFPNGCIRISPGIFNTINDINFLISSLFKISKNLY